MRKEDRKSGIDALGNVRWGTHCCQLYQTSEDLVDILVPYFKAGLKNNEFCMWITAEPLREQEAEAALREAVSDFDSYLKRGQIEILPYDGWYLKAGIFNSASVLSGWLDKLNQALVKGYDGMRLTSNTFWLEKKDWRSFADYEAVVNSMIGRYRTMAICSYYVDKLGSAEFIDVVRSHQCVLSRQADHWGATKKKNMLAKSVETSGKLFSFQPKQMLTVGEVARLLGVHPNTVRRWSRMGILRHRRVGSGYRRFLMEDVERLLRR